MTKQQQVEQLQERIKKLKETLDQLQRRHDKLKELQCLTQTNPGNYQITLLFTKELAEFDEKKMQRIDISGRSEAVYLARYCSLLLVHSWGIVHAYRWEINDLEEQLKKEL